MDKYWKNELKKSFVGSRVDGAFDRANKGSLNEKVYIDTRRKEADEVVAEILAEHEAQTQRREELREMRDYLFDHYGSSGVGLEGMQDALQEFGRQSKEHYLAKQLISGLLISNSTRADNTLSQLGLGMVGAGEQIGMIVAERFDDEKTRALARQFLGLEQNISVKARDSSTENPRSAKGDLKISPKVSGRTFQPDRSAPPNRTQSLSAPDVSSFDEALTPTSTETASRFLLHEPGRKNAPIPAPRPHTGKKQEASEVNPFDVKTPDLKLQAALLERSPVLAKQLIISARRDPKMFGL
ncbi:hypothetical protein FIV06_14790 [Labrenzia sp. THAF191b]|uniref:hypothetical protein n=1 Tax=unclassified Labrenzia TaxID=2648686 RepID=UPI001267A854|nr:MULTISPECIES: hypothetical protein [unclassified Labrenzia]QFS98692.1 hypothetical protein FIV06_14790 [Labrenzia sp. THAF191b]QFT05006.1 hypothetical protein FIV05_14785 [Labrenzia sp. THAF191a]QFT16550.1 hypothetical protein FIV03_14800 [Labrenzia sp. THAF187b]